MFKAQMSFDREIQKCKRRYWYEQQEKLLNLCKSNQGQFWKTIGKIGIKSERNFTLPYDALQTNGLVVNTKDLVLETWKNSFCNLLNEGSNKDVYIGDTCKQ